MPDARSPARVATETQGRYIAQLGQHFAHRIPATYDPPTSEATTRRVEFPEHGVCALRAEPGTLVMELTAPDDEELHRLERVVDRHLVRFAWREPPTIPWSR